MIKPFVYVAWLKHQQTRFWLRQLTHHLRIRCSHRCTHRKGKVPNGRFPVRVSLSKKSDAQPLLTGESASSEAEALTKPDLAFFAEGLSAQYLTHLHKTAHATQSRKVLDATTADVASSTHSLRVLRAEIDESYPERHPTANRHQESFGQLSADRSWSGETVCEPFGSHNGDSNKAYDLGHLIDGSISNHVPSVENSSYQISAAPLNIAKPRIADVSVAVSSSDLDNREAQDRISSTTRERHALLSSTADGVSCERHCNVAENDALGEGNLSARDTLGVTLPSHVVVLEQARIELHLSSSNTLEAYCAAKTILSWNLAGYIDSFVHSRQRSLLVDAGPNADTWHGWNSWVSALEHNAGKEFLQLRLGLLRMFEHHEVARQHVQTSKRGRGIDSEVQSYLLPNATDTQQIKYHRRRRCGKRLSLLQQVCGGDKGIILVAQKSLERLCVFAPHPKQC